MNSDWLFSVLALVVILTLPRPAELSCPKACNCIRRLVICNKPLNRSEVTEIATNITRPEIVEMLLLSYQNFLELDLCEFKSYTNLKRLSITFSKLQKIPRDVSKCLPKVQQMFLNNNQIEEILRNDFRWYHNVRTLNLENNNIKSIRPNTFQNLTFLIDISFRGNKLEQLLEDSFVGLTDLRRLDLSYNKLTYIPNNVFPTIKAIGALWLNHNQINVIASFTFHSLQMLKIELSNNNIQTFLPNTFQNTTIDSFYINENPLKCSCSMLTLLVQTTVSIHGKCAPPEQVKTQSINDVVREEVDPCLELNLCNDDAKKINILKTHLKGPINETKDCPAMVSSNENVTLILIIIIGVLIVVVAISTVIAYQYRKKYSATALVTSDISIIAYSDNNNTLTGKSKNSKHNPASGYVETLQNSSDKDVMLKDMRRKISKVVFGNLQVRNPNNSNGVLPPETPITDKPLDNSTAPTQQQKTARPAPYRKRNIQSTPVFQPSIDEEDVNDEENVKTEDNNKPAIQRSQHLSNGREKSFTNKTYETD